MVPSVSVDATEGNVDESADTETENIGKFCNSIVLEETGLTAD